MRKTATILLSAYAVLYLSVPVVFAQPTPTNTTNPAAPTAAPAATGQEACCICHQGSSRWCVRFTGIASCAAYGTANEVLAISRTAPERVLDFSCEGQPNTQGVPLTSQCIAVSPGAQTGPGLCPSTPVPASQLDSLIRPSTQAPAATSTVAPIIPNLSVPIPGLTFSPADEASGCTPWLGQYLAAVYAYLVYVSAIAAVIMVVYGGFRYMIGAGMGDVQRGKTIIVDAVIGMILVFSAYVILYTINPETLQMRPICVLPVERVDMSALGGVSGDFTGLSCTPAVANGGYYSQMWSICRSRSDGPSLPPDQQLAFLRQIIDVWKRVGIDAGGGIYMRCVSPSCRLDSRSCGVQQGTWGSSHLKAWNTDFPTNSLGLSADCLASVQSGQPSNSDCYTSVWAALNRTVIAQENRAGLYCADCITNVKNIYKCFGGMPFYNKVSDIPSRVCHTPNIFNLHQGTSDADLHAAVALLRFGDAIVDNQHAYIYTGGAGLGYEIMEMGTTQPPPPGNRIASSGVKAAQNAGFQTHVSGAGGLAIHRSAFEYLKKKVHDYQCVTAYRILDNIPESAYQALATTPLQPFATTAPTGVGTAPATPAGGDNCTESTGNQAPTVAGAHCSNWQSSMPIVSGEHYAVCDPPLNLQGERSTPEPACNRIAGAYTDTGVPCGGMYGYYLRGMTENCKSKSFGYLDGLDGTTYGLRNYTMDNFPTILAMYAEADPTLFRTTFANADLNEWYVNGTINAQRLCEIHLSSNNWSAARKASQHVTTEQKGLVCNLGMRQALQQAATLTPFIRAQNEEAFGFFKSNANAAASQLQSAYGQILFAILENNPGPTACKSVSSLLAPCHLSSSATDIDKIRCILGTGAFDYHYVNHQSYFGTTYATFNDSQYGTLVSLHCRRGGDTAKKRTWAILRALESLDPTRPMAATDKDDAAKAHADSCIGS